MQVDATVGLLSHGKHVFKSPARALGALRNILPAIRDWTLSLSQKLDRTFGNNEAVKAALVANLSYYHDDPATTWWVFFAAAQGSYLLNGGRYVQGGSQRLSSALARAIKTAGGDVILRRTASAIGFDPHGRIANLTHTAKDGSNPQIVETARVVSNAAPPAIPAMRTKSPSGCRSKSLNFSTMIVCRCRPAACSGCRDARSRSAATLGTCLPQGLHRCPDRTAERPQRVGRPPG